MLEIIINADTPLGRIRSCIKELSLKSMMCSLDVERMTMIVDPTGCNVDDIIGSIITHIGVDNISKFKEVV